MRKKGFLLSVIAILIIGGCFSGCRTEKSRRAMIQGVFLNTFDTKNESGEDMTANCLLRFGKQGHVCMRYISAKIPIDPLLPEFIKVSDEGTKYVLANKFKFKNGRVQYSDERFNYSGVIKQDTLVLETTEISTKKLTSETYTRFALDDGSIAAPFADQIAIGMWIGKGDGVFITFIVSPDGKALSDGKVQLPTMVQFINHRVSINNKAFNTYQTGNAFTGMPSFSMTGTFSSRTSVSGIVNGKISWTGSPAKFSE